MRGLIVALLVVTFLAGCGDSAPKAAGEILVESTNPEEISSNSTDEGYKPSEKTKGHLAGVVVDQAIRPLEGAVVHLPGLDLEEVTDRDGHFGFVDLQPGPYYITINKTGFYSAEAVLEVNPEKFTRAKVILEAIPPPEPRHFTQQFDGFANLGGDSLLGIFSSCTCVFSFYLEPEGLDAIVVEATMPEYQNGAGGSNSFYYQLRDYQCCRTHASGDHANPLRAEVRGEEGQLTNDQARYQLTVRPEAFPLPETNKRFTAYVTTWYNSVPPVGWSFVNGDV